MRKTNRFFAFVCFALGVLQGQAFNPPMMGWSSWNTYSYQVSDSVMRVQADALVRLGLDQVGYRFVNIDEGYWDGCFEDGHFRVDEVKFPYGIRPLVDYIHSMGLKAGIYSDAGDDACEARRRYPGGLGVGMVGREEQYCREFFIDWDFDFIKVDYCGGKHMGLDERDQYTRISQAIKRCGKPGVLFNVCRWAYPGTWVSEVADSWRTTGDINNSWRSVKHIIRQNLYLQAYTGNGHYNDCDMLEMGRTLIPDEERTHMAYWCITSSPLIIGCDLTKIPDASLSLLRNPDLLAMNQDTLGLGAPVVQRQGEVYVFAKDMERREGKKRAVVVTNLSDTTATIDVSVDALGFGGKVRVWDCFTHSVAHKKASGSFRVELPAHGSAAYFVTGRRVEKRVYEAEEAWLNAYQALYNLPTARYMERDEAQQGAFVGFLGRAADNWLEWRDVYSRKGGRYMLTLRYAAAEPRTVTLEVNGTQRHDLVRLNSGGWEDRWATVDVSVRLKPGYNVIRLSNTSDWAPNIDCMTLCRME